MLSGTAQARRPIRNAPAGRISCGLRGRIAPNAPRLAWLKNAFAGEGDGRNTVLVAPLAGSNFDVGADPQPAGKKPGRGFQRRSAIRPAIAAAALKNGVFFSYLLSGRCRSAFDSLRTASVLTPAAGQSAE